MLYYDTTVFRIALNPGDLDYCYCAQLVDLRVIRWPIAFSEISRGEASIGEWLDRFHVGCVANGIDVKEVIQSEIKLSKRGLKAQLKALAKFGMGARGTGHVAAAHAVKPCSIVSRDSDFVDPAIKRLKSPKNPPERAQRLISRELGMRVLTPREAVEGQGLSCCASSAGNG